MVHPLFGGGSIKCLVADRESGGHKWFKWLNNDAIQYMSASGTTSGWRTGEKTRAQHIFNNLKHGEERALHHIYRVCGELCYLSGAIIKDKTGKPEEALPSYKERWTIETMSKGWPISIVSSNSSGLSL